MIDVITILRDLGIDGELVGHEIVAECPNAAAHSGGRDAHPSWRIVVDPGHERYGAHFCHPCGFGGGLNGLVRHIRSCSRDDAARIIGELPSGDGFVVPIHLPRTAESRPVSRGMSELPGTCLPLEHPRVPEWARHYWVLKTGTPVRVASGFDARYGATGRLSRRIVFPARTSGLLLGYSARVVDFRPMMRRLPGDWPEDRPSRDPGEDRRRWDEERAGWIRAIGDRPDLFAARSWLESQDRRPGIRYLTPRLHPGPRGQPPETGADTTRALFFWDLVWPPDGPDVTIVEGAIKAVRLYHAGWPNPVGIPGASGLNAARIALLSTARRVWYPGDPDQAGTRLGQELTDSIAGRFTDVVPVTLRRPVDELSVGALRRIYEKNRRVVANCG